MESTIDTSVVNELDTSVVKVHCWNQSIETVNYRHICC